MAADAQAGFDSYRGLAPAGWRPLDVAADSERRAELLAGPATWALIAFADDSAVGHVAFFPGREPAGGSAKPWKERGVIPGVAHLWQLFVLPEWWGRGVAPLLHDAATAQMRAEGYRNARFFTPSLQARVGSMSDEGGYLERSTGTTSSR
jgi:GNAT superfamily N-acetyltransferase